MQNFVCSFYNMLESVSFEIYFWILSINLLGEKHPQISDPYNKMGCIVWLNKWSNVFALGTVLLNILFNLKKAFKPLLYNVLLCV